jgi:PAS domain S-box-containing protein
MDADGGDRDVSEANLAQGADPAVGALLAAHALAAVAVLPDGQVAWANDLARSLVTEPGDDPPTGDEVAATLRAKLSFDPDLLDGLRPGELRKGKVRLAATHALLEDEASVLGVGSTGGTGALIAFAAHPTWPPASADEHLRRLEVMLESTNDIITVIDRDGTIRYSNAAAQRLTGLRGTDANGSSMLEFVHPDEHGLAMATLQRILDGEEVEAVELRLRHADGVWRDVEVFVTRHDDPSGEVVLTIRDITDRIRRQEELARNERRLESIVENIDDVIVVLDRSLAVSWVSPSIERLIDAPAYTNLGENAFNDMHPDDVDGAVGVLLAAMEAPEGRGRAELRLRHQRMGWRWVEAAVVNRLDDPAVGGLVCTLRDITDQRSSNAELRRESDQQRAVADHLRDMDRLKDQFLATLSHELRTPLTSVRGFSEVMLRRSEQLDPDIRDELLERIHANAVEMEDMVQQLLDFSRLQARRVEVTLGPLDVAEAVESIVDHLAHHLGRHEVVVAIEPCRAMADRRALDHVLRNLLTNAARYSDEGTRIEVTGGLRDGEVRIAVKDQGVGIAPEEQSAIFQSFYQSTPGASGRRGTGVGLNIARRYAQLQGGRLWLESTPEVGSTFFLALHPATP